LSVALSEQRARYIALLQPAGEADELAALALNLFDSMLWVFRGNTRSNWSVSAAADAHVIVVHHSETAQRIDEWRRRGKLIVVLCTDRSARQTKHHTLAYPFPAAQLMTLLEELDKEIDGTSTQPDGAQFQRDATEAAHGVWGLAEAIRTVRAARNPDIWLVIEDERVPLLWVRGDGAFYESNPVVRARVQQGTLPCDDLSIGRTAKPRSGLMTFSGDELAWFTGFYTSGSPAPWIAGSTTYRLRRWPDFGLLRTSDPFDADAQLRVVAALDAQPATPAALVRRSQVTREHVARTLNALSLCGLIVAEPNVQELKRVEYAATKPKSGFRALFDNIRSHFQRRSA
jgi:hypothetical protein